MKNPRTEGIYDVRESQTQFFQFRVGHLLQSHSRKKLSAISNHVLRFVLLFSNPVTPADVLHGHVILFILKNLHHRWCYSFHSNMNLSKWNKPPAIARKYPPSLQLARKGRHLSESEKKNFPACNELTPNAGSCQDLPSSLRVWNSTTNYQKRRTYLYGVMGLQYSAIMFHLFARIN